MNSAFATREAPNETLQQVERRIHDGAAENQLHERAQTYVNEMFALFPWLTVSPDGVTVEGGARCRIHQFASAGVTFGLLGATISAPGKRRTQEPRPRPGLSNNLLSRIARLPVSSKLSNP